MKSDRNFNSVGVYVEYFCGYIVKQQQSKLAQVSTSRHKDIRYRIHIYVCVCIALWNVSGVMLGPEVIKNL